MDDEVNFEFFDKGSKDQNCHGYTCQAAGVPGVDKNTWLNQDGITDMLDSRFEMLQNASDARPGDYAVFYSHDETSIVHSGIVVEPPLNAADDTWIQSKFGPAGIYNVTQDLTVSFYADITNNYFLIIKYFRPK